MSFRWEGLKDHDFVGYHTKWSRNFSYCRFTVPKMSNIIRDNAEENDFCNSFKEAECNMLLDRRDQQVRRMDFVRQAVKNQCASVAQWNLPVRKSRQQQDLRDNITGQGLRSRSCTYIQSQKVSQQTIQRTTGRSSCASSTKRSRL